MTSERLLSVRNLSKSFYGSCVLDAVDLDVMAGEVHALLGENGSGKSTLIKCLSGYYAPDAGAELVVGGNRVGLPLNPAQPRVLGLAFVHQQLGLAPELTVLENLRVGRFTTGFGWRIRWRADRRHVRRALARVELEHVRPNALVASLTEVERALVAVARALEEINETGSGVLVLDEPTAYLPRDGVEHLFSAIRQVTRAGCGVLFVTHRLEEVYEIADRVTVLRDGVRVATREVATLSERELVELIVGRPMSELYPDAGQVRDDIVLSIDSAAGSAVSPFSLRLHRGETVGVTGLVGMGQETIPYLLFGADARASGEIGIGGRRLKLRRLHPHIAMRHGIGLVPGERLRNGGAALATARENITLTTLRNYFRWGWIRRARERRDVLKLMEQLDVTPRDPDRAFVELSGGNQQKAVLAKWFATQPDVLLLHEPTQGVDVGARTEVFRHVRRFTEAGGAVLIASSEFDDLAHLCDRVVVFRDGRPVAELAGENLVSESIAEQAFMSSEVRQERTTHASEEEE